MRLFLVVFAVLLPAAANAQIDAMCHGVDSDGNTRQVRLDSQGRAVTSTTSGDVPVNTSASIGIRQIQICATAAYDGGVVTRNGQYGNVYVLPTDAKSVWVENDSTANTVWFTLTGETPIAGDFGVRLAAQGGTVTSVLEGKGVDCTAAACSRLTVVASPAGQSVALDGGSGCTNVMVTR